MISISIDTTKIVRLISQLEPYPAILWPLPEGGFDVIFTNFAGLKAYGPTKDLAYSQAQAVLTAELCHLIRNRFNPPKASDPNRLHRDDDEPAGTELVMISPDEAVLKKCLGLAKQRRESVLSAISEGWSAKK